MGYFIRIAFWIVLSGCLLTNSLPISDFGVHLLRKVECLSDSTFYAPKDVKPQCITKALDCVRRELEGTVQHECNDPNQYTDMAIDYLERLGKDRALSDSEECACEKWPQVPYKEFLDKTLNLLQCDKTQSSQS